MSQGDRTRTSSRERNPVASIVRVLGVMAESDEPSFGVRELGRLLDSPPSSIQRTLEIGADVSLVRMSPAGRWELGWELYRLASLARRKPDGRSRYMHAFEAEIHHGSEQRREGPSPRLRPAPRRRRATPRHARRQQPNPFDGEGVSRYDTHGGP